MGLLVGLMVACDVVKELPAPVADTQDPAVVEKRIFYTMPTTPVVVDLLGQIPLQGTVSFRFEKWPASGNVKFIAGSLVQYTPDSTVLDTEDYFIFSAKGQSLGANPKPVEQRDTVRVRVRNDQGKIPCNAGAMPDFVRTELNKAVEIDVLDNDRFCNANLDKATLSVELPPRLGKAEIKEGRVVYTPTPGLRGVDVLLYKVCVTGDKPVCRLATVRIEIAPEPPVKCLNVPLPDAIWWFKLSKNATLVIDVLRNDTYCPEYNTPIKIGKEPRNGVASIKENKILYNPEDSFKGWDEMTYLRCDKDGRNCIETPVRILVEVPAANCQPVANRDDVLISLSKPLPVSSTAAAPVGSLEVPVLANDKLCADVQTMTVAVAPQQGRASIDKLRVFYFPKAGFVGDDQFQYEFTDEKGNRVRGLVRIKIYK